MNHKVDVRQVAQRSAGLSRKPKVWLVLNIETDQQTSSAIIARSRAIDAMHVGQHVGLKSITNGWKGEGNGVLMI